MRILSAALAAIALAAASAFGSALAAEPAEPPITNPSLMIDNATAENLTELLRELGAQQIEVREADGTKVIGFVDGGVPYNVGVTLCNARPGKCIAITLMVIVDPGTAPAYPLEVFNAFNRDSLFVTLVKLEGNKFGVGRILLIDGGVTKKNLAINVGSFVLTFHAAMKHLAGQLVAGYQRNGTFQRAGFGVVPPHPVRMSPKELARIMNTMSDQYQTTLRPRR